MATILTKKSDTASAVPLAADLTNAAGGAELAVNATDKRLFSKTSGGTVVELGINPSSLTMPNGTANGVAYLNGSKVVTSGSALTFDGTGFQLSTSTGGNFYLNSTTTGTSNQIVSLLNNGNAYGNLNYKAFDHIWSYGASEQMRLTSTGLGIGTSSVGSKLSINAASGENVITYSLAGSAKAYIGVSAGAGQIIDNSVANDYCVRSSGNILFSAGGQYEKLRLDSSGNLGLGVTPSAWNSDYKALNYGSAGFLYGRVGSQEIAFGTNWYRSSAGSFLYSTTGFASYYAQTSSSHLWFTAPSGTAGNAITFTQAMTLDASGNLGVGTTSPNFASGSGIEIQRESANATLRLDRGTTGDSSLELRAESGQTAVWTTSSTPMLFATANTERARIDSSGNLLVGTTSAYESARVTVSSAGSNGVSSTQASSGGYCFLSNAVSNGGTYYFHLFKANGTDTGSITSNGTTTTYATTSDYRLKTVIGAVTGHGARIDALEPIEYTWNSNGLRTRGFLAHKFQEVYADSVTGTKDAIDAEGNPQYQSMQAGSSEVIADLVAEIKALRVRVAQLESN